MKKNNNQHLEQDNFIKDSLKKDTISDENLFENISDSIRISKIKVSSLSYAQQLFLVFLLVVLFVLATLIILNMYFGIFTDINFNLIGTKNNHINHNNEDTLNTNTVENITNALSNNPVDMSKNTENSSINALNTLLENNVSNTENTTMQNSIESSTNSSTNSVSSTSYNNSVDGAVIFTDKDTDFSNINIKDLKKFVSDFAIGIERISFEEETLESNTLLLYIAKHYFDNTSSKPKSLQVDDSYAPTAENVHKYIYELTGKDYSKKNYINSFSNYVGYSSSSNSYAYGKDINVLAIEKYSVSDIEIIDKFHDTYTAHAKVSREIDEEITNYIITFKFSINETYKYQKFCLKSISANNLSFLPDNTRHLIEN